MPRPCAGNPSVMLDDSPSISEKTARVSGPDDVTSGTIPLVAESSIFWYGDNLTVMREHIPDATVDLIYLDPPFNSQRVYNQPLPEADGTVSQAQRKAFEDYWTWGPESEKAYGEIVLPRKRHMVSTVLSDTMEMLRRILRDSNMMAYLAMMTVRLVEMRRVLRSTGSLYLHCDPTASHYLKLLLDALFGTENFRNEIIWKRSGSHSSAEAFGPIHDVILFYARSKDTRCHPELNAYSLSYKQKFGKQDEKSGKYFQDVTLTGSGVRHGDSGMAWRGHDPTAKGRHWAIAASVYVNYAALTGEDLKKYPLLERLDRIDAAELMYWSKRSRGGLPRYKFFEEDAQGVHAQDVWTDIPPINSQAHERTDYPTQKPLPLLDRIIRASSDEGDLVLDPFCGCGTAVVAAETIKRKWIGIDITHVAVSVLKQRLEQYFPNLQYRVRGEPEDVASARKLAEDKWEEFQAWIVDKVGGMPLNPTEEKKVAKKGKDHGIDGLLLFRDDPKAERSKRIILSVKAGKSSTPEMIDALYGVMARENAPAGALLTAYQPSKGVYNEARRYGQYSSEIYGPNEKYDKIQVVTVEDIFDPKWRGLMFPGWNTSRTSVPPAGTHGASLGLFDDKPKPPKKTRSVPPDQQELPNAEGYAEKSASRPKRR